MNTDPKNNEPDQGLQLHPEHAATDTNRMGLYEVTLYITERRMAHVLVPARSVSEARQLAPSQSIRDSRTWDSEVETGFVELVTEFVREEVCDECA